MKRSSGYSFIGRFIKNRWAVAALAVLVLEVLAVLVLPTLMKLDPITYTADFNAPPSLKHWFGTDDIGRDLFSRVVCGGRISLYVGIFSAMISVGIGLPLGMIAGYFRGVAESVIMRAADVFMTLPSVILAMVIVVVFGQSVRNVTLVIGIIGWPAIARLIYANVLSVTRQEYVEAARAIGAGHLTTIGRYILPNVVAPLWAAVPFRISQAILTEASLSFLGAGVQLPTPSWGNIIFSAQNLVVLTSRPWYWVPAGIVLILTVVCVNRLGDGIRLSLDPKARRAAENSMDQT